VNWENADPRLEPTTDLAKKTLLSVGTGGLLNGNIEQGREQTLKREEKERRTMLRKLRQFDLELNARATFLLIRELEFEHRQRNKALRMARKRKARYIQ